MSKGKHCEKTEQVSEPDMAEISELVDQICKTTIIKMPRSLMEKVNSMQKQMDNIKGKVEILRQNQTEILEFKNTVTKIKNSSHGLLVDKAQGRL